jgi:cellulose synthase/poly-beta-1,6-N-acetylglucosamine synthase-like glycosyltransferase
VEDGEDISKKELMLNYYFTSRIMSLGNPAFTESDVAYMPSIAGYNSIYRADILKRYRYDAQYAFNTDDIEINMRLSRDGCVFLHAKKAKIYHRMDPDLSVFLRQMQSYGKGAMQTSLIHKKISRFYIPISLIYTLGIILTPILFLIGGILGWITLLGW